MGWFAPKCPIDSETKDWIDECFFWLAEEFGEKTLLEAPAIVPTEEFFPEPYSKDERSLRVLLQTVCRLMDVEYSSVVLEMFSEKENEVSPHPLNPVRFRGDKACGLYEMIGDKHYVAIETTLLNNPINLIATIAHELGHAKLIGEKGRTNENIDEEFLTDLLTVFFGFGVFTANSLFNFQQFTNASYQGWQMSREGYLTEEMTGYSLALFAYVRNEATPDWAKHLEVNSRTYFNKGLKYLKKTNDTKLASLR